MSQKDKEDFSKENNQKYFKETEANDFFANVEPEEDFDEDEGIAGEFAPEDFQSLFFENPRLLNVFINIKKASNYVFNAPFELQYAAGLSNILERGTLSTDRTGTGTLRIQNQKFVIDMSNDLFPILRGKKIFTDKIITEALWMLRGETNTKFLVDRGVNYWNQWANVDGELGPIYGKQMRNFGEIDQLRTVLKQLKDSPDSRRILMTLWNPTELHLQKLPPCHLLYQLCVTTDKNGEDMLDMHVTQRSGDSFLGVPYDFVLFGVFMKVISKLSGIRCNKMHYVINDFHMYLNHEVQVRQYLDNVAENKDFVINGLSWLHVEHEVPANKDIDIYLDNLVARPDFFVINNYNSYPHIKAEIAV